MNFHPDLLKFQVGEYTNQLHRQAEVERELRKSSQAIPQAASTKRIPLKTRIEPIS